jgi:hypothetical protein
MAKHGIVLENVRYREIGEATEAQIKVGQPEPMTGHQTLSIALLDHGVIIRENTKISHLTLTNIEYIRRQKTLNEDVEFKKPVTCYIEEDATGRLPGVICGDFESLSRAKRLETPLVKEVTTRRR